MSIDSIEKMIKKANMRWAINHEFAMECKRNSNPDGFLYTMQKLKYSRIIKRLEQVKNNLTLNGL